MKTQRLFWLSLALVALLLVGGVVVGFQQYKTTLSAHERSEVTQTAAQVQSDLNRSITGLERAVEIAAANPALTRHGTTAQRRALRALVERSAFSGASVIAANGTMTNIVGNVSAERRQQLVGSSFESRTYFRRAIAGRTYVSDPVAAESGNYIVTVSAPVRRGGRIVATVNAALYLSHPSRRAFFARFNSTLTSRQGLTIYARNGTRIYDVDPAPPTDLIVRNETVPATGWTVSVQESRAPIQSAIRAVTYLQVGVAFVVLGVVLGFGWWVYRRNITQLDRLREGFDALADGEYGTELSLGGADEWERIEARFNEFSDTLETEMARRETRRQELEEEHQKYTTLVEQSQDGIAIVREGRFAFANRAMADLVGCSPAELEGRALTDIVAPEDRDLVRERYEKRVAGENPPDRYDIEILTDGGERRHIDLRVSRISYRNEPATLATFTDVTDRRERERRLRQFREAVEQAGHAVYITDPDGTITYVNPAFEETTGYDASEALGETPRILQSGEYDDGFYADLWETITSGERWHHEMHDETSEGTDVILDQTISPVERDDGEIEAFVAVARDVTERIERERALERYERLVEHLPVGVYQNTAGPDGEFTLINQAMVELFDADSKAHLCEYAVSDLYCDPEERAAFSRRLDEDGIVQDEEICLETVTGDEIWGSVTAIAREIDGETVFDGAIQDITERKAYEKRLEEQRDGLDLLNQVLRHDIRNDLQVVTGYGEVLTDHVDDEGADYLDTLRTNAEHAVELTRTARDLADVMLSTEGEKRDRVPLRETLEAEIDKLDAEYPAACVAIEGSVPAVPVRADAMLDSVFRNLLTNAVQHNDKDVPEISIAATADDERVTVRIADNGPGVPDDQKETIFGKGEKGLDSEGTGLGLYLVQHLVTRYGGSVWVEDSDPTGAVFVVELPRADAGGMRIR